MKCVEMMAFGVDAALVAAIVAMTQAIKGRVGERWVPIVPAVLGMVIGILQVAYAERAVPWEWPVISGGTIEGLKLAAAASYIFKLGHTTLFGGGFGYWTPGEGSASDAGEHMAED